MLAHSRIFALGLALVALALGFRSRQMYYEASDTPARPSFDGTVAVVTNAQDDQVEIVVTEVSDAGEASGSLLQVQVNVYPGRRCRVRWRRCLRALRERDGVQVAVGLSGGATTGEGRTPRDGPLAAESDDRRQLSARGFAQPFFASQTSWPSDRTSGQGDGEVLFGKIASNCPNDVCTVLVTVPMSRSMVEDVGALWTLSTPRLGAEVIDPDFPSLRDVNLGLYIDSRVGEELKRLNPGDGW
jgi:hypothetical protein